MFSFSKNDDHQIKEINIEEEKPIQIEQQEVFNEVFCHDFYDLMAFCMELVFSRGQNVASFGIPFICNNKNKIPMELFLQMVYSSCTLLYSCKHQAHFINLLFVWINWKFTFT